MTAITVPVMAAVPGQAEMLGSLIATAFNDLEVSRWLVADPGERLRTQSGQFGLLVRHAIAHGQVHTTADSAGVAVWFPSDVPPVPGYDEDLLRICGSHIDRFASLDDAMHSRQPAPPHWHLAFLAVLPRSQNQGIGSALLRHQHRRLDELGIPAYLEAGSRQSLSLYRRHGYLHYGEPFPIGESGPSMYPMWRHPGSSDWE
jgi:GNAT superfamily N-acetyltransferase